MNSKQSAIRIVVTCGMLAQCPCAFALNAALDISQYAHTAWRFRDGFSKGVIDAIAQTPDGYLWLGTEFGLLRFDGVRTVPWQPPAGEALPSNWVRSLLAARDGTLWIGTLKGLVSVKAGTLRRYPGLAGMSADTLVEDRQGTVWVGGVRVPNGLLCAIDRGAETARCYGEDTAWGYVASVFEDSRGNLWVGATNGLWRWRPGSARRYAEFESPNVATGFIEDDGHALIIAARKGLKYLVDGRLEEYGAVHTSGLHTQQVLRDRDGGLWIATYGEGLLHLHHGRVDAFTRADGLSSDVVLALFEDREGTIWVATLGGLDRFRDFILATISAKQGLSSEGINAVATAADGGIWVGTSHGLDRLTDGRTDHYRGVSPVWFLFQKDQRLWVGTDRRFGLFERGQFVPISAMPGGVIRSMTVDRRGDAWIAYQDRGLFRLRSERHVERISWAELGHRDFASVVEADRVSDGLWLGFYNGGIAYFADGQIRGRYAAADGLGEGTVNHLKVDADGTVWAATEGGLSRVKQGRVATLTNKNGLPCDGVHWMREDDEQAQWLSTPCGLVRLTPGELETWASAADRMHGADARVKGVVFDTSDGVRSQATGTGTPRIATSIDGKLWSTEFEGVGVIDPRHLSFNRIPPPVYVEQITADRKTYDVQSAVNGNVQLPPLVRDLQIDYTALSLVAPEKMRFRYKLEDWDRDWQDVGTRRQAFYNNLPPRSYRFRVMASNNSGVWNEAGASVDFSVAPAYYQTSWFRVLVVATFLLLLAGLYQMRLRRAARQFNLTVEARVNERTRIARELHDTLLQSFHGVLFRFQAANNMLPDRPIEAKRRFESAIDQAVEALTEGRDAVQNLRAAAVDTEDLAVAITTLSQELAATPIDNPDTTPVVNVAVQGTLRALHPVLRDDVYRIAGEALRNAFRHAHAKHIEVEIRYEEKELQLRVRDDGCGVDPGVVKDRTRGHFGLPGMRERADLIGGRLDVWTQVGIGTEVELTVPGYAAYAVLRLRSWTWPVGRRGRSS